MYTYYYYTNIKCYLYANNIVAATKVYDSTKATKNWSS